MLNSSYDNINTISENKYIKDKTLQSKTIEFIINECSKTKTHIKKNSLLSLPKSSNEFQIANYHSNNNASKINYRLSKGELNKNEIINNIKRLDTRISDTSKLKKIWFNNTLKFETKKSLSTNKLTEIKTLLSKNNKMKNSIDSPCKIKRKNPKKNQNLNKLLNTISKNIQKTNEAINNPNKFYINFFNNIIQHSGYAEQEEESEFELKSKKEKNKLFHFYIGDKNKESNNLNGKDN